MDRLKCMFVRMIVLKAPALLVIAFATNPLAFPWSASSGKNHGVYAHVHTVDNHGRHINNCTPNEPSDNFPQIFGESQLGNGAIILHIVACFYLSGCIGYICQIYFVPSLELICIEWKVPHDVAGATIMATGTSLPELFAAIMGTFVTEDDTGTGAIVGSAAFNIYAILAVCAFVAPKEGVKISWFPVLRDGFYWTVCMLVLIAVVIDNQVQWWESLILTLLYVVYVILMSFNTFISEFVQGCLQKVFTFLSSDERDNNENNEDFEFRTLKTKHEGEQLNEDSSDIKQNGTMSGDEQSLIGGKHKKKNAKDKTSEKNAINHDPTMSQYGTSEAQAEFIEEALEQRNPNKLAECSHSPLFMDEDTDDSWCSVFNPPESCLKLIAWVLGLPVITLCCFTIPDCRKPGIRRKLYIVTFIMAAIGCSLFCYLLFWVTSVIGDFFGIPSIVMGYTLLAVGTSLPDLISSVIVSKHGYHDMAIANISGSNTFEILVGLGMVWLTKSLVERGAPIEMNADGFPITSSILLSCFLLTVLILLCNNWVLNRVIGAVSALFYFGFLAVAIYISLLNQHLLPPCGYIDMAIGNISGSNTFEILVCLGMVWFARSISHNNEPVHLDTHGFQILSSILLVSYLFSLLAFGLNDWVMNTKVGVVALIIYSTFLIVGTVTEHFTENECKDD